MKDYQIECEECDEVSYHYSEKKDEYQEITAYLVGSEPGSPKDGDFTARDLKQKLEVFRDELKEVSFTDFVGNEFKVSPGLKASLEQTFVYPDEMEKANQDAHVEVENFMADEGAEDLHLFGVFDGHGKTGDHCAGYVRDQLPGLLKTKCKEHPQDFEKAYKEAFIQVNEGLHKSSIDDSLSGTTAIVVLFEGGTIHVANVGDSRAIIAQQRDDHLVAYSLSRDQTPFRKDERERCKRAGARVASMDQLEGLVPMGDDQFGDEDNAGGEEGDGDPPRIWLADQMTPGCAFTRSIGDAVGEVRAPRAITAARN